MQISPKVFCKCQHKFQDETYGKGVRVTTPVNKTIIQGKLTEVRCTVCGVIHKVR